MDAVTRFAQENGATGSRYYGGWLEIETQLRAQLQTLTGAASSDEIALLKNTSEALSIVAYGMDWSSGDEIIISSQEFPSNRMVWEALESRGVEYRTLDLDGVDEPELRAALAEIAA